ncbi:MAG: hypothetical protein GX951_01965 [Mollicutes bacterium]|nr:hypothetical protein [Mollicutes bacterium]
MQDKENMPYNLALERRVRDFATVDINVIAGQQDNPQRYDAIEAIDFFTRNYTEAELYDLILKANITDDNYLAGRLWVINNKRYRYDVLTKKESLDIETILKECLNENDIKGLFLNTFNKYAPELFNEMRNAIQSKNIGKAMSISRKLSYLAARNIYFDMNKELNFGKGRVRKIKDAA